MIKIPDTKRIETLVSGYGLSLRDLPHRYKAKDRKTALDLVALWGGTNTYTRNTIDYICHLMAIIDTLTKALELSSGGGLPNAGRRAHGDADPKKPAPKKQAY